MWYRGQSTLWMGRGGVFMKSHHPSNLSKLFKQDMLVTIQLRAIDKDR